MPGAAIALGLLLPLGCAEGDSGPDGPHGRLAVSVAPLTLPGVTNACYNLLVVNGDADPVWSQYDICSDDYGDGIGSLAYVGPCDASEGVDENTVTLELVSLFTAEYPSGTGVPADQWVNPCAPGDDNCQLPRICIENADVPVVFNITIMRDARQGFFDIAVNFEDIFCSAKVDCRYSGQDAGPINLLHDANGDRGPTLVMAFACTAGPDTETSGIASTLHMNDVVVDCSGTSNDVVIDPDQLGNAYSPTALPSPPTVGAGPIYQAQVSAGVEDLVDAIYGESANKLYWTVAIGINPTELDDCNVTTSFTASQGVNDLSWETPGISYPVIDVSVPLTNEGTDEAPVLGCGGDGTHGLDADEGEDPVITTSYHPPEETFENCANDDDGDLVFCGPGVVDPPPGDDTPEDANLLGEITKNTEASGSGTVGAPDDLHDWYVFEIIEHFGTDIFTIDVRVTVTCTISGSPSWALYDEAVLLDPDTAPIVSGQCDEVDPYSYNFTYTGNGGKSYYIDVRGEYVSENTPFTVIVEDYPMGNP